MGAFSSVCFFDSVRFERDVSPALLELVRNGAKNAGPIIDARLAAALTEARASEARHAEHYRRHRRPSDALLALGDGLGVDVFGACELLSGLAVLDDDLTLHSVRPLLGGPCASLACAHRSRCPLHGAGQDRCDAEALMTFLRETISSTCASEPTVLGRHAQWYDVIDWHAYESGREVSDADEHVLAHHEELALLLRLFKRGAAIGWADGGYGEGLLGWLDADETRRLAATLAVLPPDAPTPPRLVEIDPYVASDVLPARRAMMATLVSSARTAAMRGVGLVIIRE